MDDTMDALFDVFDQENLQPLIQPSSPGRNKRKRSPYQAVAAVTNGDKHEERARSNGTRESSSSDSTSDGVGSAEEVEDKEDSVDENQEATRQRLDPEPEPLVTDAFEREEQRQIQASAGLQGAIPQPGQSVVLSHQVRHQVALPPNYIYTPISEHRPPANPAKTYPFPLDPFQSVSIASIERDESILVSAHTSAGKTVVAEYAIAQCLKNNQRVIYTSPIKALSNQKFREFQKEFGDVGLMTGDVTINPTATCLVMTTEILRSMLYRGSEIMREVAWVIFDEVHYLRDKARGVVWEETIILLPDKVRYVFLSATIPNAMQFAEWITKIHDQPCHVVYTDFRPTPLQHYLFPAGSDGIHLVVDEKGTFREDNFQLAMSSIEAKMGEDSANPNAKMKGRGKDKKISKGGNQGPSDIYKIIKMIMIRHYNPVIVFSFSKRECEALALQMAGLTFNDNSEKDMVVTIFENAISMLSAEDKALPQIQHILPLLKRGIGIHHSGLLPILKETIEILFQEGLIKVLFATETFSIGLNMPAKTVVFTSVRKFDGVEMRYVTPSEFIQMSGRAGRRGIDDRGIVIMMINETMDPVVAKEIVRGEQDRLNSAFHLGYNMILNLIRVEGISPEFMLERSFHQFQDIASVSGLERELLVREAERSMLVVPKQALIQEYHELRRQIDVYRDDMRDTINHPNYCLPFMQPGRLVKVKYQDHDFGWGAVVNYSSRRSNVKQQNHQQKSDLSPQESFIIDVLLWVADDVTITQVSKDQKKKNLPSGIRPPGDGESGKMEVVPVLLTCIEAIAHVRIFLKDIHRAESRLVAKSHLDEVARRFPDGIARLDPIENMGITDDAFRRLLRKIDALETRLFANPLHDSPQLPELYTQYRRKLDIDAQIKTLKQKISKALSLQSLDELKHRKRVLRRLGFLDESNIPLLKARVACEISTGDELLLSELLLNRFFVSLPPETIAAVLSCFVFEEKVKQAPTLPPHLTKPFAELQTTARQIARVSTESKLPLSEASYLDGFKSELMDVVHSWAKGASFAQICKMTEVYEGSLIRVFRRLEELLRQMMGACKIMGGDDSTEGKGFEEALNLIRRDIVAAQSLYL